MPELPDVEVFRRRAERLALDRTVEHASVRADGMLEDTSERSLCEALLGHQLCETFRHGKHLFLRSGEPRGRWLRLHFGMTGSLDVLEEDEAEPEHVRLRLDFRGGSRLCYTCVRKFGEIGLVDAPASFIREQQLGPDPFAADFGLREFRRCLEGRSGTIKGTLMNQEVLAGLGNLYTDEALFQARIHPQTTVDELDADEVAELWHVIDRVLAKAVDYEAEVDRMPKTWLLRNREDGVDCPRCDGTIHRLELGGRATYVCDRHQRR